MPCVCVNTQNTLSPVVGPTSTLTKLETLHYTIFCYGWIVNMITTIRMQLPLFRSYKYALNDTQYPI